VEDGEAESQIQPIKMLDSLTIKWHHFWIAELLRMSNVINVFIEPLKTISPVIRNQLTKLHIGKYNGRMLENLMGNIHKDSTEGYCEAVDPVIYYVKGKGNRVKSWAMLYRTKGYRDRYANQVDFYTKKSERKKGYATAIATAIRTVHPKKVIHGDSYRSTVFTRHKLAGAYEYD
jgi:hypothetical protein